MSVHIAPNRLQVSTDIKPGKGNIRLVEAELQRSPGIEVDAALDMIKRLAMCVASMDEATGALSLIARTVEDTVEVSATIRIANPSGTKVLSSELTTLQSGSVHEAWNKKINRVELSARTRKVLKDENITTLGQLARKDEWPQGWPGLVVQELSQLLKSFSLNLGMQPWTN